VLLQSLALGVEQSKKTIRRKVPCFGLSVPTVFLNPLHTRWAQNKRTIRISWKKRKKRKLPVVSGFVCRQSLLLEWPAADPSKVVHDETRRYSNRCITRALHISEHSSTGQLEIAGDFKVTDVHGWR